MDCVSSITGEDEELVLNCPKSFEPLYFVLLFEYYSVHVLSLLVALSFVKCFASLAP